MPSLARGRCVNSESQLLEDGMVVAPPNRHDVARHYDHVRREATNGLQASQQVPIVYVSPHVQVADLHM